MLCQRKIGCVVDAHQPLGILRDKAVPLGEQQLGLGEVLHALPEVDDGNTRALEPLEVRLGKCARHGQPFFLQVFLVEAIQELVQHVDYQRLAHEADHPLRVFLRGLGEYAIAVTKNEGPCCLGLQCASYECTARNRLHGKAPSACYTSTSTGRRCRASDHFNSSIPSPVTAEMA